MPWGPEDDAAMRDDALLRWARSAPQRPGSYDVAVSAEEQAYYSSALEKWAAERPSEPYEDYR